MPNNNKAPLRVPGNSLEPEVSKRRRILHVTSTLEDHGYIALIWFFAQLMDQEKYEVFVCCMWKGGPFIKRFNDLGVTVLNLNMKNYFDIRSIPRLVRFIKNNNIDMVHTHIRLADWYGRICAKIAKVPFIFSTIHSPDYWRRQRKYFVFALFDRLTLALTTQLIAVSNATKEFLVRWQKVNKDHISVIWPGSDIKKYSDNQGREAIRRTFGLSEDTVVFGVVARLVKQKSLHTLLNAVPLMLNESQKFKILIVGDGPLRQPLEDLSRKLGLESQIIFTGFRTDIPAVLGAIDVFVMPSIVEGLCLAVVEAMFAGKPVVATRIGGIMELIEDNKTGILVSPEDPSALSAALSEVLNNPERREELGRTGKAHALENFCMERMVAELEKFYDNYK